MFRYFLHIAYKGTAYHGWQVQENAITVQQVINEKLSIILQEKINVTGAGRTDTGVHAEYFMLHFDVLKPIHDIAKFLDKMNKISPVDIAVYQLFKAPQEANVRFDALSRSYEYRITRTKNPFLTNLAWYYRVPLNVDLMGQAAKILFDYTDFTSFSKTGTQVKTNNCKIYEAKWLEKDNNMLIFKIKADRFLRNMVRAITGTLFDVGRGKLSLDDFRVIIESKNRSNAGLSVPAHGLFLTDIEYPEGLIKRV
ncbi:MAG: tRNA pseudouridine(38-40) synthase TruA [Bacteroidetes bacterium 4572_117]|nr:MAG: tRNA pseudouridine(38-40) synthase TruA [Bacteroidetes bacterium 4572_117]